MKYTAVEEKQKNVSLEGKKNLEKSSALFFLHLWEMKRVLSENDSPRRYSVFIMR